MIVPQSQQPWLAIDDDPYYLYSYECQPGEEPWMTLEIEILPNCPPIFLPFLCSTKPSDFAALVPLDLSRVKTFSDLNPDQLKCILSSVAQIVLQGFCLMDWHYVFDKIGSDEQRLVAIRKTLFQTLSKIVLTIYDMVDFQTCFDEINIVKCTNFFGDYLIQKYGTTDKSFTEAMVDIAQGGIDFNQFPFLREEDVSFTLEWYRMQCTIVYNPGHVTNWPFFSSTLIRPCVVFKQHQEAVENVLHKYIRLTDAEKMELLLEMAQEPTLKTGDATNYPKQELRSFGPLMRALSLEPWKDIQPSDFDVFNNTKDSISDCSVYFPRQIFRIIDDLILSKASQVRILMKCTAFPLRCGVWGSFADEVQQVFRMAHINKRRLGYRFLSADLILSEIRHAQIGEKVNALLLQYKQTPTFCGNEYIGKYIVPCICRWAEYVAKKLDCARPCKIKLEHVVLAIVFGKGLLDWDAIMKQGFVYEFVEQCNVVDYASGYSPEQSPEKKKMKLSKDVIDAIIFDGTDSVPDQYDNDYEGETRDHMERLWEELKKYGGLPRKKVLEQKQAPRASIECT